MHRCICARERMRRGNAESEYRGQCRERIPAHRALYRHPHRLWHDGAARHLARRPARVWLPAGSPTASAALRRWAPGTGALRPRLKDPCARTGAGTPSHTSACATRREGRGAAPSGHAPRNPAAEMQCPGGQSLPPSSKRAGRKGGGGGKRKSSCSGEFVTALQRGAGGSRGGCTRCNAVARGRFDLRALHPR